MKVMSATASAAAAAAATTDTSAPGWQCPASDEELAADGDKDSDGWWTPPAAQLEHLYLELEQRGLLELEWRCRGRAQPAAGGASTPAPASPSQDRDGVATDAVEESDFDFKEEMSSLRLRVRREGEDTLRGSAKKKTTSFDGVVSNMMRHKRMQQQQQQQQRLDTNPANNTPQ